MHLPIDFGTLPEPPRDICTMAAKVAENLEWSYQIAREIICFKHRRDESSNNVSLVKKQYKPTNLVCLLQHTHSNEVPSKVYPKFSGLCEIFEVRGLTLTLRNLDTD